MPPAGSEQGAALQGGRQNSPAHGACWPSQSVEAGSGAVGASARSAKEAAAPEASGASDGRGAAPSSGGAGGGCAGLRGRAEAAGAQQPANPGTGFARAAQPLAHQAGHGRGTAGAHGRGRAREAARPALALQALQQRAREFAEHVFARGPPPAAHPCPGVYKAGGHGCGAPLRFAPICLAPGKVVERWRCSRSGDGCGYAEFPAPRLRWPQLALEAASPDAFQVQAAPGAEEAAAFCGGLRALLAAIGVPASLELPGGAPAGNPDPDPVTDAGSLGERGRAASVAVQAGGAQRLPGPGVPQDAAGMPGGERGHPCEPPDPVAGLEAAECADAAGGPCWRGAQPSQPHAAAGGPDGQQEDPSASCHAHPDVGSSRLAMERMSGSGGAALLDEVPAAASAELAGGSGAAHGSEVDLSSAGQPTMLAPLDPSSSETPRPPAAEQPVCMAWPHYAGVVAVLRGRRHGLRNLLGPAGLVPEGTLAALR